MEGEVAEDKGRMFQLWKGAADHGSLEALELLATSYEVIHSPTITPSSPTHAGVSHMHLFLDFYIASLPLSVHSLAGEWRLTMRRA